MRIESVVGRRKNDFKFKVSSRFPGRHTHSSQPILSTAMYSEERGLCALICFGFAITFCFVRCIFGTVGAVF